MTDDVRVSLGSNHEIPTGRPTEERGLAHRAWRMMLAFAGIWSGGGLLLDLPLRPAVQQWLSIFRRYLKRWLHYALRWIWHRSRLVWIAGRRFLWRNCSRWRGSAGYRVFLSG